MLRLTLTLALTLTLNPTLALALNLILTLTLNPASRCVQGATQCYVDPLQMKKTEIASDDLMRPNTKKVSELSQRGVELIG